MMLKAEKSMPQANECFLSNPYCLIVLLFEEMSVQHVAVETVNQMDIVKFEP